MPRQLLPDIVAGVLVAVGFIVGLVLAYRRGFRDAQNLRSDAFDFLPTRLGLDGTRWRPVFNEAADTSIQPGILAFRQVGSRFTANGRDEDGVAWNLEGVVHGQRLWCMIRGHRGERTQTSAWVLVAEQRGLLTGYSIRWERGRGAPFVMRELRLEQVLDANVPAEAPLADDIETPEPAES